MLCRDLTQKGKSFTGVTALTGAIANRPAGQPPSRSYNIGKRDRQKIVGCFKYGRYRFVWCVCVVLEADCVRACQ